MEISNSSIFKAAIVQALAEAEAIATKARDNPTAYLQPEIMDWIAKWALSRYMTSGTAFGLFDRLEAEAVNNFSAIFNSPVTVPPYFYFQAEATGEAKDSQAVFNQIHNIRRNFTNGRVDQLYDLYRIAIEKMRQADAYSVFENLWRGALIEIIRLGNTMLKKMDQGPRPMPQPGPGQHIVRTPFGDDVYAIVDDVPEKVVDLTVGQLRQILAEAVEPVLKQIQVDINASTKEKS